ncbi:efflux RND transporter periplasmic adaptor subunit [Estrella lausannensis]|uniref:Uncharacterized protein n=1 Tax=Estrella lausannensis TaxID=483423 RepID=A0A0H5DPJ6_9BACT|nr:efflux RND transporter periplasmic adaptor subunit [Estrella lausannensis]CRX38491.1 hypothetical protein ELAC_1148 [Estrella lausannensis]
MMRCIYRLFPFALALSLMTGCNEGKKMKAERPPVAVSAAAVEERTVPLFLSAIGNIAAPATVEVFPQVTGMIVEEFVQDGDFVEKDQLLYSIDPRPFKAALDKAKATLLKDKAALDLAETTLKRYEQLVSEDYVSRLNYDTYKTNVETLKAQILIDQADVDNAELNYNYAFIHAPIGGKISEVLFNVGNIVSPGQSKPINTIRQLDPIDVRFHLPQPDYQKIIRESPKTLQVFVSLPEEELLYEGTVYFIDNTLMTNNGTILFKAKIDNPKRLLWPGDFVTIKVLLKELERAKLIPKSALQFGQQGSFVFVIKDDMTVEVRPIAIVTSAEEYFAVESGLAPGEKVVTEGQINLKPGSKVVIVPEKKTANTR